MKELSIEEIHEGTLGILKKIMVNILLLIVNQIQV